MCYLLYNWVCAVGAINRFMVNDDCVWGAVLSPAKNRTSMEGSSLWGSHILVGETDIKETKTTDWDNICKGQRVKR